MFLSALFFLVSSGTEASVGVSVDAMIDFPLPSSFHKRLWKNIWCHAVPKQDVLVNLPYSFNVKQFEINQVL